MWGRIVYGTDGSAVALLAREVLASVTIVFVGHPATGQLVMQDTIDVYGQGIETEVRLLEGDPTEQILKAANDADAELLVVGNKGIAGAKGFLMGSIPEK